MSSGPTYARRIGLFSAVMIVIGGIIGSGIFRNPSVVPQYVHTAPLTLAVWVLGGVIALLGAFIFSELGARQPEAGGGYVYLRDAFGPLPAFLYAWTLLLVIATGAIAAVAITFANYAVALFGLPGRATLPLAVSAIALLSAVNYIGVTPGAITQNIFTVLKLAALAALIGVGLFLAPAAAPAAVRETPPPSLLVAVGAALVPVLFSYGGWQQTNFVAAEMRHPERDLPRAICLGVIGVIAVYLLANFTYLHALGATGLAASTAPAADAMRRVLGPTGATVIAAGIAISTFGFLNLVILVSPRVYQAMASDGLFFPAFARLHPRWRTPAVAIVAQAIWATVLALSGGYDALTAYVVFGDWIFFGLTAATLLVFRARDRRAGAPPATTFRAPAAPVITTLFVLAAVYVVIGSIASQPANALKGTGLILLGVPVFLFWRRRSR